MSDSSSDEVASKKRKKSKKAKKKSKRKEKLDPHERSSSPHSSDSSSTERRKRKEKKSKKKAKKRKRSVKSPLGVVADSSQLAVTGPQEPSSGIADRLRLLAEPTPGPLLADAAVHPEVKPKGPMTKEQWEKHQNTLRRVHDPETGRTRLIRGDGEIMEEIVTKDMHLAINKAATKADGAYFQSVLGLKKNK